MINSLRLVERVNMKNINIMNIDLNLMKTFLAICEERSLTAAADRLHLSQPAVSHALRRLRDIFGDPLFIRTASAMEPTDAALKLYPPIENALGLIHGALTIHSKFDPQTASRTFNISMSDMSQMYILPFIMNIMSSTAPGLCINVVQVPNESLDQALRRGEVDIAVGYFNHPGEECIFEELLQDEFVCMVRAGHPIAQHQLTKEHLSELRFIEISSNITIHNVIADAAFARASIYRNIALKMPNFTTAPKIIEKTDLALIVSRKIAETINENIRFKILDLPVDIPAIRVGIYRDNRLVGDNGIVWLRDQIVSIFEKNK